MKKKGTLIKLPTDLYAFDFDILAPTIATPGNNQFGGADISLAFDARQPTPTAFVAFTAREKATNIFGFVIWNLSKNTKVPYQPFCNARGELSPQGHWIAWNDNDFHFGPIPGFVLPPRATVPQIPPDGAISSLYQGVYKAADLDTPAELALRVGKQLAAINELVALLIAAGVVRR